MKTDMQIQEDVIEQLKWNPAVNAAEIGVAVTHGVVTLSGKVQSFNQKIMAEQSVRKVTGVKAIAENLEVGISPNEKKTDAELAEAIVDAFYWNNAVPEGKIKIKVEDGVVTLDGSVYFEYQRAAATEAVQKLNGIVRINNMIALEVQPASGDVKKQIMAAFHRSATIDASKVHVEVRGNKVILSGTVRSLSEYDDACEAAWAAPGIDMIDNQLQLEHEALVVD